MGSLFAKIIHMASGPVRPIREWSIVRFVLLAMFWAAATLIVGFWCLFYDNSGVFNSFEDVVRWIGENLKSPMSILRPLALLGGIVLGGGHYLILRAVPFESRVAIRSAEKWITLSALVLLAIVPACQVRWWFRARDLVRICGGIGIYSKLEALKGWGDYEGMVAKMEEDCFAFQTAKAELGEWYLPHNPCGGGMSYLFITLGAYHGEPYMLNSPLGLSEYLFSYENDFESSDAPPPRSCEPLAKAMVESKVPVIRLTGLWWLGRRGAFEEEVRALVDGGDTSFQSWKGLGAR